MEQLSISRFGDFTFDPTQRRLLQAGQDVYLPPKTFELLLYLIHNSGRADGVASRLLTLPLYPGLSDDSVDLVTSRLIEGVREARSARERGSSRDVPQPR